MHETLNLYSTLLHRASHEPERAAVIELDRRWTFHELLAAVDRAADVFWGLGVRKGDRVAITLRNSAEFIISHFALAKIGAAAVPINYLITKQDELHFILSDSKTKGLVTQTKFAAPYIRLKSRLPELEFIVAVDGSPHGALDFRQLLKEARYHPHAHNRRAAPRDIASLLYTSGTTGHPKGVILTHENLLANARSCIHAFRVNRNDKFLCLLPMFHTFAWTTTSVLPIMLGAASVVASHITPAKTWLFMMGREGVTVVPAIPQVFSVLAKEARGLKRLYLEHWAFRKVKFCISGAAPLPAATLNHFEKTLRVPLMEGYGLTETAPVAAANTPWARRDGSVGKPIPEVRVKIIDDAENVLGPSEEGEICIRGRNISPGYYNNPEATTELYTKDGWLKTGDVGLLDEEGFLFIKDRKKDMIIIKGLKVFSAQVEAAVLEHPAIAEAAVIGVPDGSGGELIKCFCVLKPGHNPAKSELLRSVREKLDPYKRPREIEIMDALPKNSLNKVLKRKLREDETKKRRALVHASL